MKIEVFPSAEKRIEEIWSYTDATWGEKQADNYTHGLGKAISQLPENRGFWRKLNDEILEGIFFIRFEHHYIFFREFKNQDIGIISILHETMDIPSRLREDNDKIA